MNDKKYLQYLSENDLFNFQDKKENVYQQSLYMLMRTQKMFKWSGLPDTIPERMLEQYLQINGCCAITEVDDDLYAFYGGLGGEPDEYYQPTIFTVSNPYLRYNENLEINKECVLIRNDCFYMGLIPMFNKYASLLTENELSMYMAMINTRVQYALSAGDDATKEACQKFLDDLIKGKVGVLGDNAFLETLKSIPMTTSTNTNVLGDLIETEQYIKASWFNELGLNANYNMKREALNSAESSINDDILFPLVDHMLKERQEGALQVNKMFGMDISVELSSSWKDNKLEEETLIDDLSDNEETEDEIEDEDKEGNENDVSDNT